MSHTSPVKIHFVILGEFFRIPHRKDAKECYALYLEKVPLCGIFYISFPRVTWVIIPENCEMFSKDIPGESFCKFF